MELGELMREFRKAHGLSMEAFGKQVGLSKGYISQLESGINPANGKPIRPTVETIRRIAGGMEENADELMRILYGTSARGTSAVLPEPPDTDIPDVPGIVPVPPQRRYPLLGTIACGQPILAEQNIETYVTADAGLKADFCLRCKGDSMINARIFDGDLVFFRAQSSVENGEIAGVLVEDWETEATLKRVHLFSDHVVLEAENPRYRPLVFWGQDMERVRIVGKAVYFLSDIF